jgi:hypothetical protein
MTPRTLSKSAKQRPLPLQQPADEPVDSIFQFIGPLATTRALIVAERGLDLLCALLQRGCAATTCLRPTARMEAAAHDLVIVPDVTGLPSLDDTIRAARHALLPFGRVIIGIGGHRANGPLALALTRRLQLNGFTAIRTKAGSGLTLVQAELASNGRQP